MDALNNKVYFQYDAAFVSELIFENLQGLVIESGLCGFLAGLLILLLLDPNDVTEEPSVQKS